MTRCFNVLRFLRATLLTERLRISGKSREEGVVPKKQYYRIAKDKHLKGHVFRGSGSPHSR